MERLKQGPLLATFEDGHVDDGADLGDLVLRRGCWRVLEVAASPADSGWGSGWGWHAANQWQEHQQPQTGIQHGDGAWMSTNTSRFKMNTGGFCFLFLQGDKWTLSGLGEIP